MLSESDSESKSQSESESGSESGGGSECQRTVSPEPQMAREIRVYTVFCKVHGGRNPSVSSIQSTVFCILYSVFNTMSCILYPAS